MEEINCLEAEWSPSLEISEDRLDRQLSGQVQFSCLEEENWMASWAWNFTISSFPAAAHPVLALEGEAHTGNILLQETPHLSSPLLYHKSTADPWKLLLSHDWIDKEHLSSSSAEVRFDLYHLQQPTSPQAIRPSHPTLSPERGLAGDYSYKFRF